MTTPTTPEGLAQYDHLPPHGGDRYFLADRDGREERPVPITERGERELMGARLRRELAERPFGQDWAEVLAVRLIAFGAVALLGVTAVATLTDDPLAPTLAGVCAPVPVLYAVGWVWRWRLRRQAVGEATHDAQPGETVDIRLYEQS